jgi:hypothetical protein
LAPQCINTWGRGGESRLRVEISSPVREKPIDGPEPRKELDNSALSFPSSRADCNGKADDGIVARFRTLGPLSRTEHRLRPGSLKGHWGRVTCVSRHGSA